ncbi:MAG: DUF6468 domain-containing protein [Alphaproteobacteria bacterium]
MTFPLIFDSLLAVLLVVTIAYAAILNGRLRDMRRGREEMRGLIAGFDEATARAQAATAGLKETEVAIAQPLRVELERGRALRDELAFLTERGERLSERIAAASAPGARPAETGDGGEPVPFARTPAAGPRKTGARRPGAEPAASGRRGEGRPGESNGPGKSTGSVGRSAAESELLRALRAAR